MNDINLVDINEIILSGDIRYLRFVEKNSNKLYLVEDYIEDSLENKVERLKQFKTIADVKQYFIDKDPNTNIFEFISAQELKYHLNEIRAMSDDDKKKLTAIIKDVKQLNINYVNFTYFFVETKDAKLYFATLNKKTNIASLKNLKIEKIRRPIDIKKVMRDIKAYGAFKFNERTVKYIDILPFIENPLLIPEEELIDVIKMIRNEQSKNRVQDIVSKPLVENESNKEKIYKKEQIIDKNEKQVIQKVMDKPKKNKSEKRLRDSLMLCCLIGFSAGVVLAAITIIVGSYV